MSNQRKKLEDRADELGVEYARSMPDSELQILINEAENPEASRDMRYYKSIALPGLSIQIGDSPTGQQDQPQHVQFVPYAFFDEEKGDHYRVGFLATDEQDAIEVLVDDTNVIEIDEDEYKDGVENHTRAKL